MIPRLWSPQKHDFVFRMFIADCTAEQSYATCSSACTVSMPAWWPDRYATPPAWRPDSAWQLAICSTMRKGCLCSSIYTQCHTSTRSGMASVNGMLYQASPHHTQSSLCPNIVTKKAPSVCKAWALFRRSTFREMGSCPVLPQPLGKLRNILPRRNCHTFTAPVDEVCFLSQSVGQGSTLPQTYNNHRALRGSISSHRTLRAGRLSWSPHTHNRIM